MEIGRNRQARRSYGFDEVALAPAAITVDPEDVNLSLKIRDLDFSLPVLASAMDGAVDPRIAIEISRLGGLAVLNLEGIQTRYENPKEVLSAIASAPNEELVSLLQKTYSQPIQENLVGKRIKEIKDQGARVAVSSAPANAERLLSIAIDTGADVVVIQSTVTTVEHLSSKVKPFPMAEFCKKSSVPVLIGNCVTYEAALKIMEAGADAVLVGVGPGAACTTRRVLGLGIPQVTATADVAAAREDYFRTHRRYVSVICDGGIRTGGDVAKAIACGADGIMIGSPIAAATEAPGQGYHWGMATSHAGLPRGTRIKVGISGTLKEILLGPANKDDGTLNLMGALRTAMGCCGALTIRDMQQAELLIAPSLPTEGKRDQKEQRVGMGK